MLIKKHDALLIGGFSVLFKKVGEDLDFSHRAYNENYRFVFLPSSQVYHNQNISFEKWLYKMFSFGKVQITVQKLNYKQGLRLYRLLPLFALLVSAAFTLFFYQQALILILLMLFASLFKPAFLGFLLTSACYAIGESFELIYPTVELKNEQELMATKKDLSSQVLKPNI